MADYYNMMLVIIVLLGLAGTLLPSLPGTAIILAGALLHALLTDFAPLTWQTIMILALICLVSYGGQYLVTGATCKQMGASRSGIIGAGLGMVAGLLLPIPGGLFAGAFLGGVAFELVFELKDLREALKSGLAALTGTMLALFFEFGIGLGMASLIFYLLFRVTP